MSTDPATPAALVRVLLAGALMAGLWLAWSTREPLVLEKGAADFEPAESWSENHNLSYEFNRANAPLGCSRHHLVCGEWGQATYRFKVPAMARVGQPVLTATISSEHAGWTAPADWISDVTVVVNGTEIAHEIAPPDDGAGRTCSWPVPPALIRPGEAVTVQFRVAADAVHRHGFCIYGHAMAKQVSDACVRLALAPR